MKILVPYGASFLLGRKFRQSRSMVTALTATPVPVFAARYPKLIQFNSLPKFWQVKQNRFPPNDATCNGTPNRRVFANLLVLITWFSDSPSVPECGKKLNANKIYELSQYLRSCLSKTWSKLQTFTRGGDWDVFLQVIGVVLPFQV